MGRVEDLLQFVEDVLGGLHDFTGAGEEELPGGGEVNLARGAFEQGHAELVFHATDLPGDGTLGQSGGLRRLREAAGIRHKLEQIQVVKIEGTPGQVFMHKQHQSNQTNELCAT